MSTKDLSPNKNKNNPPFFQAGGTFAPVQTTSAGNSIISAMSLLDQIDMAEIKMKQLSTQPGNSLLPSLELDSEKRKNWMQQLPEQTAYLSRVPELILDEMQPSQYMQFRKSFLNSNQKKLQSRRRTLEEHFHMIPSQSQSINCNITTNNNINQNSQYGKLFQQPSKIQKTNSFHVVSPTLSNIVPSSQRTKLSQRNSSQILPTSYSSQRESMNIQNHMGSFSINSATPLLTAGSSALISPRHQEDLFSSARHLKLNPVNKKFAPRQSQIQFNFNKTNMNSSNAFNLRSILNEDKKEDNPLPNLLSTTALSFKQQKHAKLLTEENPPKDIQDLIVQMRSEVKKEDLLQYSDLKDIIEKVKKEFSFIKTAQNNNLRKGGDRLEIINLCTWVDQATLELLKKDNCSLEEFISEFELIYKDCINEITRQVSNDCFERGQLLEKLWQIVFFIMKEFTKNAGYKQRVSETTQLQELNRLHSFYNQKLKAQIEYSNSLQALVDNKDQLLRSMYQQKESMKKKHKQEELTYQVLMNDYDFLERYLESFSAQNLQLRLKIANFEAIERVFLKDSDPKKKIKEEMNMIAESLQDAFAYQLQEEKQALQDIYEIRKDSRYKAMAIEQTLDIAVNFYYSLHFISQSFLIQFKTGTLEKKRGVADLFNQNGNAPIEDQYGTIEMLEQETDTADLFQFKEGSTDTKDLIILASKETNTFINVKEVEVQASVSTKEMGTQADIKKVLIQKKGNISEVISDNISEVMSRFRDTKYPIEQICQSNFDVKRIQDDQFNLWKDRNQEITWLLQHKDEYMTQDFEFLRNELQVNVSRIQEYVGMLVDLLQKEQEKGRAYKIETYETQLDKQIILETQQFTNSTLKKIIPKYNELKKEIQILNLNQAQLIFSKAEGNNLNNIQQNPNIAGRRKDPASNKNNNAILPNQKPSQSTKSKVDDSPSKSPLKRSDTLTKAVNTFKQFSSKSNSNKTSTMQLIPTNDPPPLEEETTQNNNNNNNSDSSPSPLISPTSTVSY